MFGQMLVPLDGSERAEQALPVAARIARATGGSLLLVQVVTPPIDDSGGLAPVPIGTGEVVEEEQLARSYLATVAERVETQVTEKGLAFTTSVEVASDVASALLDVAEQAGPGGCDLIAISTHGRHGISRWVMGSVTERLLDTTHLPMLIVRPKPRRYKEDGETSEQR